MTCHSVALAKDGGKGGIRTLGTLRYTVFPGLPFKPLTHLSIFFIILPLLFLSHTLSRPKILRKITKLGNRV